MILRIIFVAFFAFVCSVEAVQPFYRTHSCVWESFEASCTGGHVILIESALFGRLRSSRCFNLTTDEKPCFADVQPFVERHCGGKRDCRIKLTNGNLKLFPSNCSMYWQQSMEVIYSCEDVYSAQDQACVANQSLVVTSQSGYLANILTDETGQGSQLCPWRFTPRSDQTVHLTLLDFGVWIDKVDRDRRNICRIYATIKDIEATHRSDTMVCGGQLPREKFIMTTDTEITISMMRQQNRVNDTAYFFIKYQVFDCPNYSVPERANAERSGTGIRITCQYNRDLVREVKCVAGKWTPSYTINCPEMTTTAATVSPCPEIQPPEGTFVNRTLIGDMWYCSDGTSAELRCVNGNWTSQQKNTCFDTVTGSAQTSADPGSDQLKMIVIVAAVGLVALVIVVSIAAVIACRRRRPAANEMKCSLRSHTNNSYCSGQLRLPDQRPDRARSEIYETLDESRMQDAGDAPPLPSTSSGWSSAEPRSAKTLQANQKLEPWTGASLDRRCGTLPVHRPLPEPNEYTTPLNRDSTYLMPRDPVYLNPVGVDGTMKENM